jgi:hypothetical protein
LLIGYLELGAKFWLDPPLRPLRARPGFAVRLALRLGLRRVRAALLLGRLLPIATHIQPGRADRTGDKEQNCDYPRDVPGHFR